MGSCSSCRSKILGAERLEDVTICCGEFLLNMDSTETARATRGWYNHVPAAGCRSHGGDQGVAGLLKQLERPPTPPHQTKYRYNSQQPGQHVRHFGVAADEVPAGPYGARGYGSPGATAQAAMAQSSSSAWTDWKQQQAESAYERYGLQDSVPALAFLATQDDYMKVHCWHALCWSFPRFS